MHASAPAPARRLPTVPALQRRRADGSVLRRPPEVEQEIAEALDVGHDDLIARARLEDPEDPARLSCECLVHFVRRDLQGDRRLADRLLPILLRRAARLLRGAVRGFPPHLRDEICEETLSRFAVALTDGDDADFFEARFALALKRMRIDVSRRYRRRIARTGTQEPVDPDEVAVPWEPEEALAARRALASLSEDERQAVVLRHLMGFPIRSKSPEKTTLVELLGVSERTVRNRLRRAEAKLADVVGLPFRSKENSR